MKHTVGLRNITLGEGRPKLCVPLIGGTREDLLRELSEIKKIPFDIVEWRADFFEEASNSGRVLETLEELRHGLDEAPILFTFRSQAEGGEDTGFSKERYAELLREVASSGGADMIDVEYLSGIGEEISRLAGRAGTKAVVSRHDFEKTPPREEIVRQLEEMLSCPADISKIALTPASPQDVLDLISAVAYMRETHPERLMIAISMGSLGLTTRINAEAIGSVITFGAASKASAPGQIAAGELRAALDLIHKTGTGV